MGGWRISFDYEGRRVHLAVGLDNGDRADKAVRARYPGCNAMEVYPLKAEEFSALGLSEGVILVMDCLPINHR